MKTKQFNANADTSRKTAAVGNKWGKYRAASSATERTSANGLMEDDAVGISDYLSLEKKNNDYALSDE
jgi:hypothetical protein